jgi:hypothetical protein
VGEAFLEGSYLAEPDVLAGFVEPLLPALQAPSRTSRRSDRTIKKTSNGHSWRIADEDVQKALAILMPIHPNGSGQS